MKLNIDGALFVDQEHTGLGMVVRNNQGRFCFGASIAIPEAHEPEEIKLLAILRGLQLCLAQGISKFQVKSDCLLMVNIYNEANPLDSRFEIVANEIKRLKERFKDHTLSFVRREHNAPTHLFTRHAWLIQTIVT